MLLNRRKRRSTTESASAVYLAFTTQPGTSGASPYTLSPQPVVAAKKSKGTTDTAKAGTVTIALVALTGSPVLSGTTTKALSSGVADFSANGLTVTGAGTWYLTATLSGLTGATSNTGTTTAATNYAIQLAATTGVAKTASSVANLEPITGITVRLRVKGALLTPAANAQYFSLSDASNMKVGLMLVPSGGTVQPYVLIGGSGLTTIGGTYNASVITDGTAWYDILATCDSAGATDKRQFIVWKVGTTSPVVDNHTGLATVALPTTAGQAIVALGQSPAALYNSPGLDCDWLAIYSGSPYSASNSSAGSTSPAAPTTSDTNILHLWNFPENTGTSTADSVAAGPSLTLTGATWEVGS